MNKAVVAALALPLALTGCAGKGNDATITVSAAASLTDAFTEIGEAFVQANPDTDVRFNFAGSSALAEQINAGAPVDVFAAASPAAMQVTTDTGSTSNPLTFATNSLAIAVPPGNPANIGDLSDLSNPAVTSVICDERVPCGAATQELIAATGLALTPASLEPDVRAVLAKVMADEADAGIVYRTDILAAGDQVQSVAIPDDINVRNDYWIAATTEANDAAREFVDFVLGEQGQAILRSWRFTRP